MLNYICCKNKEEFIEKASDNTILCISGKQLFVEAYSSLDLANHRIIVFDNDLELQKNGLRIAEKNIDILPIMDFMNYYADTIVVLITAAVEDCLVIKAQVDKISNTKRILGYLYYSFRIGTTLYERSVGREKKIISNFNTSCLRIIPEGNKDFQVQVIQLKHRLEQNGIK